MNPRVRVVVMACVSLSILCHMLLAQAPASRPRPASKRSEVKAAFAGIWTGVFGSNTVDQTKIVLMMQQNEATVTGTYQTGAGTQGVLWGSVQSNGQAQLSAEQKGPGGPATFTINAQVRGNRLEFSYKGLAGGRTEEGQGHAIKAKIDLSQAVIK